MKIFRRYTAALSAWVLLAFLAMICPLDSLADGEETLPAEDAFVVAGVPTNLGLAYSMSLDVSQKSLAVLSGQLGGHRVFFRAGREHSGNPLLLTTLAEAARRQGLRITASASEADLLLECSILELRIAYTGTDRSAFGLGKEIERAGSIVLACSLFDAGGVELAGTQQDVLVQDKFPQDLQGLLASETYPFTSPELSEKDWSKAVEPFVVVSLITGLVYLFFSNQSSE